MLCKMLKNIVTQFFIAKNNSILCGSFFTNSGLFLGVLKHFCKDRKASHLSLLNALKTLFKLLLELMLELVSRVVISRVLISKIDFNWNKMIGNSLKMAHKN